jgi:phosphorylcholine metabolism protein LicD
MITKEQARKNLSDIKEILDNLGIIFYLDGGTLLGAYRDNDFCLQDQDDIDLTTDIKNWVKVNRAIKLAEKKGFEVYHIWDRKKYEKRLGSPCTSQISFKRDEGKVDLMFKRKKGEYQWWTIFKGKDVVYKKIPYSFVEELTKIPFYGEDHYIPKKIDEYLSWRYGDWRTKIHRFDYNCYTSDKSIVNSYEEI